MSKSDKPLAVALGDSASTKHSLVGGKGANLGRMVSAGLPVPPGFVLTTASYLSFIAENNIQGHIDEALKGLDVSDVARLEGLTAEIRRRIEQAPLPAELERTVTELYSGLCEQKFEYVAVRSSATAEDLADTSFAGLHDTFLDVRGLENVVDAVKRCWASLWTSRCTSYRDTHDIPHDVAIAVVVQAMVDAEVAGVMFTANPVTGNTSEIVINSSYGLGEGVVSGVLEPDEFIITRGDERKVRRRHLGLKEVEIVRNPETGEGTITRPVPDERQQQFTLEDGQINDLIAMSAKIENEYEGLPQDIEWAWSKGSPRLLQTRPITGVRLSWDEDLDTWQDRRAPESTLWTNTWAQAFWTGAITPLYYTIRARGIKELDDANFRMWGRKEMIGTQRYMYRHGTMYYNLDIFGELNQMLVPVSLRGNSVDLYPQDQRAAAASAPFRLLRCIRLHLGAMIMSRGKHGPFAFLRSCYTWMRNKKYQYKTPTAEELTAMSDEDLRKAAWAAILNFNDFNQYPRTGFWLYSPLTFELVRKMLKRWYHGSNENCFEQLVSGLPARSAAVHESLAVWGLSREISCSKVLQDLLTQHDGAAFFEACREHEDGRQFLSRYEEFLEEWGHRGHADRDMWYPRRSEDPGIDVRAFRLLSKAQTSPEAAEEKLVARRLETTKDIEGHFGRGLLGFARLWLFRALQRYNLRFLVLRDDQRDQNDRNTMRKKRVFLEAGRRLFERGLIREPNDFYFLSQAELWDLLIRGRRNQGNLIDHKIAGRKANFVEMQKRVAQPENYLVGTQNPVEVHEQQDASADVDVLRGAVLSRGVYEGKIRVVKSLDEIDTLAAGDILVCNGTDPGWTPVFNVIGGLIMETGGMLAHGACLSREFGLPAVTIPGAIHKFADVAVARLDAVAGEVRILARHTDPFPTIEDVVIVPSHRTVSVDGLVNMRDLGGLTTQNGRCIREGVLYRSDQLDFLTPSGTEQLFHKLGISTVVDLRTEAEAAKASNWRKTNPGIKVTNLPIDDGWHGTIPAEAKQIGRNVLTAKYLGYLQHSATNVVEAIRCIVQTSPGGATLVHCAAGKDRTGVVCAFVLELLGVDREAVVEDYFLTNPNMHKILGRLADNPLFIERRKTSPPEVYEVRRETMEGLLEEVDQRYGGVKKWLLQNGLGEEDIEKLRKLLLA